MENSKTYDLVILRKLRARMVAALKRINYVIGTHFNLSSAEAHTTSFTIEFIMGTKNVPTHSIIGWKTASMKALTKEFGNHYSVDHKSKILIVHLRDVYKTLFKEQTAKGANVKKQTRGRSKGEVSILEKEMVDYLHMHTTLRLKERGSGFIIVPRPAGERYVTLSFAGEIPFNKALCCLETVYADNIKIIETDKKWSFAISNDDLSFTPTEKEARLVAENFLIKLKQAVRVLDEKVIVLTPYLVIAREAVTKIDIQFSSLAVMPAFNRVAEKFSATREGPVVTITVSTEEKEQYATEDLVFIRANRKKGFKYNELETNGTTHRTYTHISMDYHEFHLLPFNRKVVKKHVLEIIESIRNFGVLSFIIIAETDCIDGKMKKWIVDGQHRFTGFKSEGLPILYTKVEVFTKEEMVRLIAKLNCTSSNWSLKNYLDAWSSLHVYDYDFLRKKYKDTKLPLTLLIQICENKASIKSAQSSFLDGTFRVYDEKQAIKYIDMLVLTQKYLPVSRDIFAGLYVFMRNMGDMYSNDHMIKQLEIQKDALPFIQGDELAHIVAKFETIYSMSQAQIA